MYSQISKLALERFTNFGDLLKFLRRRSGLTQRELSIAVGYSHAQISRLELNQRQPDLATITARFIPVLDLGDEPEIAERLLELALEMPEKADPTPGLPPYKGLQFFEEEDASLFFGREKLTSALLDRLRVQISAQTSLRFLAIVGASGSGKSSVLRAGLLPTLRRSRPFSHWQIHRFTPTDRPLEALASTLNRETTSVISTATLMDDVARDRRALHLAVSRLSDREKKLSPRSQTPEGLLLVIDQFEELFTLCRNETERDAFIDNLITAASEPGGKTFVLLALRADFYSHCAPYAELRDALADRQEYIGAMNAAELRCAMEEPAKRGDWELEPGLVELLIQDIGAERDHPPEPGALPLMSHALLETWHRRRGRKLTISGYLATGGIRGAIADTADDIFQNELDEKQQEIARNIFLRLTQLGENEETADTRRRVSLEELVHRPGEEALVRNVLTRLADARLITTDNEVVEVAHEALIREWPALREWLEEDREGLRLHRHLTLAAQGWQRHGRDPGDLYRSVRLARAAAWAEKHPGALSSFEEAFLEASQELAKQEEAEREAQRQRELETAQALAETQQQAATQLRRRAIYLTGAFILALVMFGMALYQGNQARRTALNAQNERRIATSRELAAASLNNLDVDPERSILLAMQSVSTTRSVDGTVLPESLEALHRSIVTSPIRMTLEGHEASVLSASYRPDGSQLATIAFDGTVIIWNPSSGQELLRIPGTTEPGDLVTTKRIAYSPDGKLLLATDKNFLNVYNPVSGDLIQTLSGHQADVTAIAVDLDGKRIASGGLDGSAILWDLSSGEHILELAGHGDAVENLTFSPDGSWLVTASDDATMKIWDTATGELLQDYKDFSGVVLGVTFSPDGKRLVFSDGTLHVWQLDRTSGEDQTQIKHQELFAIPGASPDAFSPDGSKIAGVSGNDIKLWEAATGRELLRLAGHTGWAMGLAFSPDGSSLASTSLDGTVKVWSLSPGNEAIAVSEVVAGFGTRIAYNQNGQEFGTNGGDGTATLWNAETGQPRLKLKGHKLEVMNIAFSPDGTRFATGSLDGTVILWDATTGQKLHTLTAHAFGVRDLAFSPGGSIIASGGFDGTAKLWDASTGVLLHTMTGHQGLVLGVAFNPEGNRLATSSTDATAKVWDIKTGQLLFTLEGHETGIREVIYSPDGSMLATGSGDGAVILWDAATGSQKFTLTGHSSGIQSLDFSPDGKLLATGSEDNTAKVWDLNTGQEILALPGSGGGVTGVLFQPRDDGIHLLVSSTDGVVRLFLLRLDDLLTLAQSRVTRSFTIEECKKYLHLAQCPAP
jgi:WD40 repeat protein